MSFFKLLVVVSLAGTVGLKAGSPSHEVTSEQARIHRLADYAIKQHACEQDGFYLNAGGTTCVDLDGHPHAIPELR